MTEILNKEFSRTSFLKGGGAMIVGFSLAGAAVAGKAGAAASPAGYNPSLTQLDSWLRINADNTVDAAHEPGRGRPGHLDRLPDGRRRGARHGPRAR